MIDNCSGEWILSIDADEIISEELAVEISEEIKKENNTVEVYELREKVVCFGKLIKHGGFSGRYKTKLFKKCEDRFSDLEVHEYYETNKATAKLKEYYYHYSFDSLEQYIEKTNKYSTLSAIDNKNKGKKFNLIRFFLDPGFKFIQKYIFRLIKAILEIIFNKKIYLSGRLSFSRIKDNYMFNYFISTATNLTIPC